MIHNKQVSEVALNLYTLFKSRFTLLLLQVPLGGYIVNSFDFYSHSLIGKLTVFADSGVQFPETDHDQFHFPHMDFSSRIKNRVGLVLAKTVKIMN